MVSQICHWPKIDPHLLARYNRLPMDSHEVWMWEALAEAAKAAVLGDIPIGAVAVCNGVIIGRGCNRKEADGDPTAHAEIIALRQASQVLGGWRLPNVTLYCTLEPC